METLSYKGGLIIPFLLLLGFFSCNNQEKKTLDTDQPDGIFQLADSVQISKFKDVFIVATFQCKGCVLDKIQDFVNEPNNSYSINQIAFIIDTTKDYNAYYSTLKDLGFKIFYASSQKIDKYFPRIANIALLRVNANHQFDAPITINAKDSSMLYYIKGGNKPGENSTSI